MDTSDSWWFQWTTRKLWKKLGCQQKAPQILHLHLWELQTSSFFGRCFFVLLSPHSPKQHFVALQALLFGFLLPFLCRRQGLKGCANLNPSFYCPAKGWFFVTKMGRNWEIFVRYHTTSPNKQIKFDSIGFLLINLLHNSHNQSKSSQKKQQEWWPPKKESTWWFFTNWVEKICKTSNWIIQTSNFRGRKVPKMFELPQNLWESPIFQRIPFPPQLPLLSWDHLRLGLFGCGVPRCRTQILGSAPTGCRV